MPPKAIADLIDAPPTPIVSLSPDKSVMLLMQPPALPSIDELAQPELRLAGMRINPRTNGRSRSRYYNRLTLKAIEGGAERVIGGLPSNPRIQYVSWSPDGKRIAFALITKNRYELWTADIATARARRVVDRALNAAYTRPFEWVSDSASIVCKLVPANRPPPPQAPETPTGPTIQENMGKAAPARTYQDLLANAHDEDLFDYYTTSQVARVSLDGAVTHLGKPGVVRTATPSPDGRYILAVTTHRPYSYIVPASRFPRLIEVWDATGKTVHTVADLPLAEEIPVAFGAVRIGPRSVEWRADTPATLVWVEAQDGGDPNTKADVRDRMLTLRAPFDATPRTLIELGQRFEGYIWGDDSLAIVSEWWWKTRNQRVWRIKPGDASSSPELLFDYSWEDRYNDPGSPMTRRTERGTHVLLSDGGKLFYRGRGASPEGDRPFLDALDLATKKSERLWRSKAPYYEYAIDLLDVDALKMLSWRESPTESPNYFIRDVKRDRLTKVTEFPHPSPVMADVQKELIRYERADGVKLTGTLYLPPGYDAERDGPLPMLMWAYPQEFKSADAAGQVTDSPYRFIRVSTHSPLLWLVHGYAVLDDPSLPIVGEGDEEPNDTYVPQLVAGAKAAVEEVVRRGVADRDRIAIGGHSYGAFMSANLLAWSDLFRAGIARSGAYNRTLTPFGFQAEERTFWEAPEIYFGMSPFMHAELIDEPLLLIHGQADNNSGTFPMQSERFYHALKGLGAKVRLVMLPHESHGYRARESVMHMAWEMTEWLDRNVKNAPTREPVMGESKSVKSTG